MVVKGKIPPLVRNHTPAVQPCPITSLIEVLWCARTFNSANFYDNLKYTFIILQFADLTVS